MSNQPEGNSHEDAPRTKDRDQNDDHHDRLGGRYLAEPAMGRQRLAGLGTLVLHGGRCRPGRGGHPVAVCKLPGAEEAFPDTAVDQLRPGGLRLLHAADRLIPINPTTTFNDPAGMPAVLFCLLFVAIGT